LDKRIGKLIPAQLAYACQFWADHLNGTCKEDAEPEIIKGIHDLLYRHLLYWLEVLSVIGAVTVAPHALKIVYEWVKVS